MPFTLRFREDPKVRTSDVERSRNLSETPGVREDSSNKDSDFGVVYWSLVAVYRFSCGGFHHGTCVLDSQKELQQGDRRKNGGLVRERWFVWIFLVSVWIEIGPLRRAAAQAEVQLVPRHDPRSGTWARVTDSRRCLVPSDPRAISPGCL